MPSSALHVARTGLEAQDARMRVIANNLANIGTTGFKRDRANFATLAYQDARVAGQQSSNETAYATGVNLGTGVSIQSTTSITTQGTLNPTGNAASPEILQSQPMVVVCGKSVCIPRSSPLLTRCVSSRKTLSWL